MGRLKVTVVDLDSGETGETEVPDNNYLLLTTGSAI